MEILHLETAGGGGGKSSDPRRPLHRHCEQSPMASLG
jgi:hypothetical protein